jgi:hypothetical protein
MENALCPTNASAMLDSQASLVRRLRCAHRAAIAAVIVKVPPVFVRVLLAGHHQIAKSPSVLKIALETVHAFVLGFVDALRDGLALPVTLPIVRLRVYMAPVVLEQMIWERLLPIATVRLAGVVRLVRHLVVRSVLITGLVLLLANVIATTAGRAKLVTFRDATLSLGATKHTASVFIRSTVSVFRDGVELIVQYRSVRTPVIRGLAILASALVSVLAPREPRVLVVTSLTARMTARTMASAFTRHVATAPV